MLAVGTKLEAAKYAASHNIETIIMVITQIIVWVLGYFAKKNPNIKEALFIQNIQSLNLPLYKSFSNSSIGIW